MSVPHATNMSIAPVAVDERIGATYCSNRLRSVVSDFLFRFGLGVVTVIFRVFCRGRLHGIQQLQNPLTSGFILACNHVSYLDWIVVYAYFYRVHNIHLTFLAKDKLFSHPVWGRVMHLAGCVRVSDCGSRILDRRGYRRLRFAKYVAIFPEGTRSADGRLGPAKPGVVKLAQRLDKPIVPAALCGFFETWPRHRWLPKPHACSIRFGEPLCLSSEDRVDRLAEHEAEATTHELMKRIAALQAVGTRREPSVNLLQYFSQRFPQGEIHDRCRDTTTAK